VKTFQVCWHRYDDRKIFVVGFLFYDKEWFFKYNKHQLSSAIENGFRLFPEFLNKDQTYSSRELFNTFFIRYEKSANILDKMMIENGSLVTDNITIVPIKEKVDISHEKSRS